VNDIRFSTTKLHLKGPENMRMDKWNFVSLGLPVDRVSSTDHSFSSFNSDSHLVISRIQCKKIYFAETKCQEHMRYEVKGKGVTVHVMKAYGGVRYISSLS
jgi:hypothetical protein